MKFWEFGSTRITLLSKVLVIWITHACLRGKVALQNLDTNAKIWVTLRTAEKDKSLKIE
jgi:hypothetical protein